MSQHAPDVLDFLVTIVVTATDEKRFRATNSTFMTCVAYGILMNSRWRELSLIQKVNSILLGFGNATDRVMISILLKDFHYYFYFLLLLVKRLIDY